MADKSAHWDQRYQTGDAPWDSGIVERELVRFLSDGVIPRGRAFEFGCGSGTNAVYLAQQGFEVVAADCSAIALNQARALSAEAGVRVNFIVADLCCLNDVRNSLGSKSSSYAGTFSFLFDRGCFHCARKLDLSGFLETLDWLAAPHARFLMLCGNPNEQADGGPPRVTEDQIRSELDELFEIDVIQPFRFEDRGGASGPLGWACKMTRRPVIRK